MGEQRTVRLPDGSVVYMNAQSQLRVSYADNARDLELLDGEAIFKVERVPDRPFRVHTRTAVIQALGTQFNVYRRPEGSTVVSVLEGKVRVSQPTLKDAATLDTGEEANVASTGAIVKRTRADLPRAIAWRERRLVFREDRLEDIAAEFARYSPRLIVLADNIARDKRITGTFDADDPASLVAFLEQKVDELAVVQRGNEFVIRERE